MCQETNNKAAICIKCGMCCKGLKPYSIVLFPSDIKRLCRKFQMSKEMFIDTYCVSKILRYGSKKISILYFKIMKDRNCAFLCENECSIYDDRPAQCRKTPYGFFSYYDIWKYMPCVQQLGYPEGESYDSDLKLIEELMDGYK